MVRLGGNIPFEPAIRTWNCSRIAPVFVHASAVTGEPHSVHLMVVTLMGLGHAGAGARKGSRSKKMLKDVHRV